MAEYVLKLERPPTETERELKERRRRVLGSMVSHFFLIACGIQIWLSLLAMLIRAIDDHEELVKFFDLRQIENTPKAGDGDFFNAIRYHKSTYYLAAILVSFFLLGIFSAIITCNAGCQTPVRGESCLCCDCYCPDCPGCSCPECPGGSTCEGDCGSFCAVLLIVVVIFFVIYGVVAFLIMFVTWLHRAVQKLYQLQALRELAGEYIVQDLSELPELPTPSAPSQEDIETAVVWSTDQATQRSVYMDLQAVYGVNAV